MVYSELTQQSAWLAELGTLSAPYRLVPFLFSIRDNLFCFQIKNQSASQPSFTKKYPTHEWGGIFQAIWPLQIKSRQGGSDRRVQVNT